jgi:hypothetical protein
MRRGSAPLRGVLIKREGESVQVGGECRDARVKKRSLVMRCFPALQNALDSRLYSRV